MPYLPRAVAAELDRRLRSAGAVIIEGPKACGKTGTVLRMAASHVRLDVEEQARMATGIAPVTVPAGATPRLIDE